MGPKTMVAVTHGLRARFLRTLDDLCISFRNWTLYLQLVLGHGFQSGAKNR